MSKKNKTRNKRLGLHKFKYVFRKTRSVSKENFRISSEDYVLTNRGEMDMLSKYILDYPTIETGGQLFGYWTFDGKPVVLFVLGPGPKAGHYNSFFMQDLDYLKRCASILKRNYGLDHVGEWHSHHQLGLDYPSGYDSHNISSNMRELGYKKFLLCIGTCTRSESSINAFMFCSDKENYYRIPWIVKEIDSPYRSIISDNCGHEFILPFTKTPNMVNLFTQGASKLLKIDYSKSYWLTQKNNPKILKAIIDNLKENNPFNDFITTLDKSNEVHIEVYNEGSFIEDIHFTTNFPIEPPIIRNSSGHSLYNPPKWHYNGDILNSFLSYYNNINTQNYDVSK